MGQKGDHAVDAVFQSQAQRLVQQHHLRPHVGKQHLEQHQIEHRSHPQRDAHVGTVVQHIEAEIDEENLQRDHHGIQHTGHKAGLEVALERLAVGHPPVARLVAQRAQDGIVHSGQRGPGQQTAHGGTAQHHRQAVLQKADVHQTDDRCKPDAGQQVCKEHPVHITAYKLKKAADAGLAGGVLFDTLTGLEIIGRRKKTHSNCGTSLVFLTGTAGVLSGKCHCAGFTDINIPVFCQLCKIQPGLIVKKYLSLPFLRKMCYNDNGIFCNRRKPL